MPKAPTQRDVDLARESLARVPNEYDQHEPSYWVGVLESALEILLRACEES